jgi:hypothetical protein
MTPHLKILTLPLVLLACAAFAQSYQYATTPFAKLRTMASFQARVDSVIYWDQKEVKIAETPELWVYVTQTNGTRMILVWHDATTQHVAFARSLQVSNSYRFPEVWDEFVTPKNKK